MTIPDLLRRNRQWAEGREQASPGYFAALTGLQTPRYLWIGCADSRVPANEIVGLASGELFVHRNVANVVVHTDLNCLSVLQYAVDVLRVEHVIVCGHYGCGGVEAAHDDRRLGLIDNWLRHVQDVALKHDAELGALEARRARLDRLCELNVLEQADSVARTTIMQEAWSRDQQVSVHAWVYGLTDGLLRPLREPHGGPRAG